MDATKTFEEQMNKLIADLPKMAVQSLEKAQREIVENPPQDIRRIKDETEYLKVVNAVFTRELKIGG